MNLSHSTDRSSIAICQTKISGASKKGTQLDLSLSNRRKEKGIASYAIVHLLHRHMIMIHSPFSSVRKRERKIQLCCLLLERDCHVLCCILGLFILCL